MRTILPDPTESQTLSLSKNAPSPTDSTHYERSVLDNGIRVLTSRMTHTKAVSAVFLVGAGSRYETDEEAGVSHLFEHMLFKGTPSRPRPRDISGVIESVGGAINAFYGSGVHWLLVPHGFAALSAWRGGSSGHHHEPVVQG